MTKLRVGLLCIAIVLTFLLATSAYGQVRATGRLDGTVVDPTGAVVPGAKITLVDNATQSTKTAVAGPEGNFAFLGLQVGQYKVTVEAQGFQRGIFNEIKIDAGRVSNLTATLQIGGSEQTVEVQAAAQALETTTTTLTTTIPVQALNDLPLSGHDVFNFSILTAGAQMGGTSRNATIQGLPGGSLNVTMDGIINSSPRFRSGGTSMFGFVSPRLGAVEEMSVSTVGSGADSAGSGAMQMKFVTKRGTNNWHGNGFWQLRNDALNSNSWYNHAAGVKKPRMRISEFGGGIGGPIIKNKLFFFANYEEYRNPSSYTNTNTMLTADAMAGNFSYLDSKTKATHTFNVFSIVGQSFDAMKNQQVLSILDNIAKTRTNAGASYVDSNDPNIWRLSWLVPQNPKSRFPTARIDYEVNDKLKLHAVDNMTWQWGASHAEDFPGYNNATINGSTRSVGSIAAEYAITPHLFNEFNIGLQYTLEIFDSGGSLAKYPALNDSRFPGAAMQLNFPYVSSGLTTPLPWHRNAPVINLYDNLTWVKGRHTFTFGGSYDRRWMWERYDGEGLFSIGVGMLGSDSIADQLQTLYYQGNPQGTNPLTGKAYDCAVDGTGPMKCMNEDVLGDVQSVYALLKGTTTDYYLGRNVDTKTGQFSNTAPQMQAELQHEFGLYFQDSFRMTPSLTLNYGFRNQFQPANHNTNNTYTNPTVADLYGPSTALQQPGTVNGILNPQIYLRPSPYKGDLLNPAPNFGFAWNPEIKDGFLGKLFGGKKTVLRGSYGITSFTEGMLNFQDSVGNNPGWYQANWATGGWDFTPGTLKVGDPIPFMWSSPDSFKFPIPMSYFGWNSYFGTSMPNLRTPYVQNWSVGIQRELGESRVVEVRYVGNKGTHLWRAYNINQVDTLKNGFVTEFVNAQKNMAINTQNGRTGFANNGLPGQVNLPIFSAIASANGSYPAYNVFADGTFIGYLNRGEAGGLANYIAGSLNYFCPMVGGKMQTCSDYGYTDPGTYPLNFFRANPYAGTARLLDDPSWSKYNSLQVEFRQKYWKGLNFQANYTYSSTRTDRFGDWGDSTYDYINVFNPAMDAGPSPFDIHHTFTAFGTYELPFGKGKAFAINNPVAERVIGGWSLSTIIRYQTGRPFRLNGGRATVNGSDGGVILNGITAQQLQDAIGVYPHPAGRNVYYIDPKLLGPTGTLDPKYFTTPAPGQWGDIIYLYGPKLWNVDFTAVKRIPVTESVKMEFYAEFLNAFNHPNWGVGGSGSTNNTASIRSQSFGQTGSMQGLNTNRQIQMRLAVTF